MKIVKRVGERLLPRWLRDELRPVLAVAGAGAALYAGSLVLVQRGWARLGEHLNVGERLGALGFAGYATVYGCAHAPDIARFAVPAAAVAWCAAAWWHAPPAPADPAPQAAASGTADAFTQWLLILMEDRPGIHLRDLYPAMRKLSGHEDRDNAQLRGALNALDIPVRRSLRLGGVAGRSGVARADLAPPPSPAGEFPGEPDGDAGQAVDSPGGEQPGEWLESA